MAARANLPASEILAFSASSALESSLIKDSSAGEICLVAVSSRIFSKPVEEDSVVDFWWVVESFRLMFCNSCLRIWSSRTFDASLSPKSLWSSIISCELDSPLITVPVDLVPVEKVTYGFSFVRHNFTHNIRITAGSWNDPVSHIENLLLGVVLIA